MDNKKIKKLIEIAKEGQVSKLSYKDKEYEISISFEKEANGFVAHYPQSVAPANTVAPSQQSVAVPTKPEKSYHEIKAPFVGTYYSSSGPGEAAFVNVGDSVSHGQTLCILEAMKIMNEIDSDAQGKVVEICVENESFVEYGQTLFKIEK